MSQLVLTPGHQQTVFPQESSGLFVSQEISTESKADCYVVRATFIGTVPTSHQLAITDSAIEDQDVESCTEIADAQCIDGVVSGQTLTFNQCGINVQFPKFFSLFVDGTSVYKMEFMQMNGEVFQSPGPSISLLPNQCAAMALDATELYTPRGLMLQSHMDFASDCTMAISVCDLFESEMCSVFDVIDEDKEWESSKEQCIPDQSMQFITMCNIGNGACTPSLNYEPCHYEQSVRMETDAATPVENVMALAVLSLSVLFVAAVFGLCFKCIVGLCRRIKQNGQRDAYTVFMKEEAKSGERQTMTL